MSDDSEILNRAREVLTLESEGLLMVREALDDAFVAAVKLLEQRLAEGGKVVVTGVGKNYHIAQKIAATLSSTGSPAVVLDVQQAMHGDMGIVSPRDALLALSYSGESDELLSLAEVVRRRGIPIVAFTAGATNSLARLSDVVVPVMVEREACPFNMAPTVSTTATLAVGDAIAMVLLDRREFTEEDYAQLHPGGAIGGTLLLKVSDIMRTGDRLAKVRRGLSVRDAMFAMTKARSGSAGIVDDVDRLLGIFTDGDLRRHVYNDATVLDRPIETVMTANPIVLRAGERAADVLKIYSQHEIDNLLVVDDAGRLVGVIDIQQLPKLKIM